MPKTKNNLTTKQQAFVDYHRSNPDVPNYEAYRKFYKVKSDRVAEANASRLLSNAKVVAYLAEKQELIEKRADFDQEQWYQKQLKVLALCLGEVSVQTIEEYLDENCEVQRVMLEQRGFNAAGANKALEQIAKMKRWLNEIPPVIPVTQNNYQQITFVAADMDEE